MTITKRFIQYTDYPLIDRLIVEGDNYWGIDTNKNLIHNDKVVAKLSDEITFALPYFCRFGPEEFLLIDRDGEEETSINAWIISESGEIKTRLSVGTDVSRVHAQKEKIIVGYGDYAEKMSLVIFDRQGNILKEFNWDADLGTGGEVIAICQKNENELFVKCHCPNKISTINLDTYELINYTPIHEDYFRILSYKEGYLYTGWDDGDVDYSPKDLDYSNHTLSMHRMKLSDLDKSILSIEYLGKVPCLPFRAQSLPNGQLLFTDTQGLMYKDGKASYWVVGF